MSDVVVHRCVVRIRRTGGWTWGASPDALLAAATRALPPLIGARLPAIAARQPRPVHVVTPVEVRIALSRSQLAALADRGTPAATALRDRIADMVGSAIDRAIDHTTDHATDHAISGRAGAPAAPRGRATSDAASLAGTADDLAGHDAAGSAPRDAARRAVRTWWQTGVLAAVLGRLEPGALVWLHDVLLGDAAHTAVPGPEIVAAAARAAQQVAGWSGGPTLRQRRIAIAAGLLAAFPSLAAAALGAAVDRVAPRDPLGDARRPGDPGRGPAPPGLGEASGDRRASGVPRDREDRDDREPGALVAPRPERARAIAAPAFAAPASTGELEVRSALPFLLLSPLHHAGWLDESTTLLAAHRRAPAAFALAAGLAAKVLDPLDRGWKRHSADRMALAAFAGRSEPIADAEIRAAAAELGPVLGALDAGLRARLARARKPGPQVLWRGAHGWLLVDTDGMVALATASDLRGVLAAAHAAPVITPGIAPGITPVTPVIVPAACADAATFDQLDNANLRFISDAPPTRGEPWRSFAGTARRLYTNDTETPDGRLVAATAGLDDTLALVAELAALLGERPVVPGDPVTGLEATCTLAATAALADIAARLFPAEPATPALVLARFRDLDARIALDADRIRVRVPLGRRHADLVRHGLVGEFAGVPWLGGRTLDLAGG